jgi:hypothetical protein
MVDPVFGAITFKRTKGWNGWWTRDTHGEYGVRIFGRESGPSREQRELFEKFERRRAEVLAAVEVEMLEEYNKIREIEREAYVSEKAEGFDEDFPPMKAASEMWKLARLAGVEVYGDRFDFCLLFEMNWGDPEHVLSVTLQNWKVVSVGKEG